MTPFRKIGFCGRPIRFLNKGLKRLRRIARCSHLEISVAGFRRRRADAENNQIAGRCLLGCLRRGLLKSRIITDQMIGGQHQTHGIIAMGFCTWRTASAIAGAVLRPRGSSK